MGRPWRPGKTSPTSSQRCPHSPGPCSNIAPRALDRSLVVGTLTACH
jgi:hypothetical protein